MKLKSEPPEDNEVDWIGPPDPDSNMRPRKYHVRLDETTTELRFRLMQEDTNRWNHNFWAEQNKNFIQSKERFVQAELARLGPDLQTGDRLTSEQFSIFYRAFLLEHHHKHVQYNTEWYKRNIGLLWPAIKVMFIRFVKRRTKPMATKGNQDK